MILLRPWLRPSSLFTNHANLASLPFARFRAAPFLRLYKPCKPRFPPVRSVSGCALSAAFASHANLASLPFARFRAAPFLRPLQTMQTSLPFRSLGFGLRPIRKGKNRILYASIGFCSFLFLHGLAFEYYTIVFFFMEVLQMDLNVRFHTNVLHGFA